MKGVKFLLWGKVAHFLQPAFSVYWATYPVPPRTALQGIVGAVLGMDRDTPQIELKDAQFSVSGPVPMTHIHSSNLRKNAVPSISNSYNVDTLLKNVGEKVSAFQALTTQVNQEWLFEPKWTICAHLPDQYLEDFIRRLKDQEFYFTPYLGKSGMFAMMEFLAAGEFEALPDGEYDVHSVVRRTPATDLNLSVNMALMSMKMPWCVSPERVFRASPDPYLIQRDGHPIPVRTPDAYKFDNQTIMFL